MLADPNAHAFEARKLDVEVADRLGAKFWNGKFTFDYRKDGELLFRKCRSADKRFWIEPSGAKLEFWGLDEVPVLPSRPKEPLVICEGEFDRIAIVQAAGGYVLSVPNGANSARSTTEIIIAEDTGFSFLWNGEKLIANVDQFDKIVLAVDDDAAGRILRDELSLRLGAARCWFVTYPRGTKDANEVLAQHGDKAVAELISGAKPMRPGHLVRPMDIPPKATTVAYSTGWGKLDNNLMLERPEIMVVTGIPNHGKGQFIRCLAFNLARAHGWKTAFLAQEDSAHRVQRDMLRFAQSKYLKIYSGQPSWVMTEQERLASENWVNNHFRISMMPEDEPVTMEMVEAEMEAAVLHHDCQVFALDPWNEVEHLKRKGELETEYIERSLRRLWRKVRRLNIVLIIAAHPTKLDEGKVPQLYSISGSANWKNKCYHGVIIHRDDLTHSTVTRFIVEKSKDHETLGCPGERFLEFDRLQCNYSVMTE